MKADPVVGMFTHANYVNNSVLKRFFIQIIFAL